MLCHIAFKIYLFQMSKRGDGFTIIRKTRAANQFPLCNMHLPLYKIMRRAATMDPSPPSTSTCTQ